LRADNQVIVLTDGCSLEVLYGDEYEAPKGPIGPTGMQGEVGCSKESGPVGVKGDVGQAGVDVSKYVKEALAAYDKALPARLRQFHIRGT
jgi:hypothetical protein